MPLFPKYKQLAIAASLAYLFLYCSCNTRTEWYDNDFRQVYGQAHKLYNEADKAQAESYIHKAYNGRYIKAPVVKYLYYSFETMYYINTNDIDRSLNYADSALAILEKDNRHKIFYEEYIHSLLDKAYILSKLGQHDKAYDFYLKAGMLAETRFDVCSRNEYNYHIGMSLYKQGKFPGAFHYFEKAFTDANQCTPGHKPYYRMQELLDNMGLCCMQHGQYDSGRYYYDSALSFIKKYESNIGGARTAELAKAVVYKNEASNMIYVGHRDTAEVLLLRCINIGQQPGYDSGLALAAKIILAGVYHLDHKYDKMYSVLQSVRHDLDITPRPSIEWAWKEWMYAYYESMGQYEQAYKSYHESVAFNDSMNRREEKTKTDIVVELKDKQQQYQISMLRKNSELDRLYLWITIGFAVLSIVIIVLIYQYYKKSMQKNREINIQKSALEKSNKEKDRILNVVAHDLRNPIGNIAYIADIMLMEDGSSLPEEDAFKMIRESAGGSLSLVNELLGFSGDGKGDIRKTPTDIVAMTRSCVQSMSYKAMEKKQSLHCEVPAGAIVMAIDKEKISRVLDNLVSNAIKFSKEHTEILIKVSKAKNSVQVAVSDSGIGIPGALLPALFEMFTESRRKGTANERSYGLGLSISKQIMELHNGTITVTSEEGKGSTFVIEFPYNGIS